MTESKYCNDYGDLPGCLGVPDERYTMRFDDIGEQPILWCAYCGPRAAALALILDAALTVNGPDFQTAFEALLKSAAESQTKQ